MHFMLATGHDLRYVMLWFTQGSLNNMSRRWFNDSRFTFNGPQRLRDSISQLAAELNQVGEHRPELVQQLHTQLRRLNLLLNQRNDGEGVLAAENVNGTVANNMMLGGQEFVIDIEIARPSTSSGSNLVAADDDENSGLGRNRTWGSSLETSASSTSGDFTGELALGPNNDGSSSVVSSPGLPPVGTAGHSPNTPVIAQIMPPDFGRDSDYIPDSDGQTASVRASARNVRVSLDSQNVNVGNSDGSANDDINATNSPEVGVGAGEEATSLTAEWRQITQLAQNPEMQAIVKFAFYILPFLGIFLAKTVLDHVEGIIVVTLFSVLFWHSDATIVQLVAAKAERRLYAALLTAGVLLFNICSLYKYFENERLYYCIYFVPPWTLLETGASLVATLWVVIATDFVVKFGTMIMKALVVALPESVAPCKRRGRFYSFIERASQLYRFCLPMMPWSCYLYSSKSQGGVVKGISITLIICYFYAKTTRVFPLLKSFSHAFVDLFQPVSYGRVPTTTAMMEAGSSCPVCYGDLKDPVQLACKHIFCETCLSTWFDKEKTCPMCRAEITKASPAWKDGSTSPIPQLF